MTASTLALLLTLFIITTAQASDLLARSLNRTNANANACRLDLSDELFGGVGEACVRPGLDRSRCCPVLAAWLFAAHARSALQVQPTDDEGPMMPDDSQRCVESLQSALGRRGIALPRPNSTCDTVLCFCGIRLHQIGSLSCPAAFNLSGVAVPTAAVLGLQRDCRNASYFGCTRCLRSLGKVRGHGSSGTVGDMDDDRADKMFARDCQLMGLTWLLAMNKTAYIPTVSAVLRAILYSARPTSSGHYRCSPDQENMPLAVDALQFQHDDSSGVHFISWSFRLLVCSIAAPVLLLLFY